MNATGNPEQCSFCTENADGSMSTGDISADLPVCEACFEQVCDWRAELLEDVVPLGEEWRAVPVFGVA